MSPEELRPADTPCEGRFLYGKRYLEIPIVDSHGLDEDQINSVVRANFAGGRYFVIVQDSWMAQLHIDPKIRVLSIEHTTTPMGMWLEREKKGMGLNPNSRPILLGRTPEEQLEVTWCHPRKTDKLRKAKIIFQRFSQNGNGQMPVLLLNRCEFLETSSAA